MAAWRPRLLVKRVPVNKSFLKQITEDLDDIPKQ